MTKLLLTMQLVDLMQLAVDVVVHKCFFVRLWLMQLWYLFLHFPWKDKLFLLEPKEQRRDFLELYLWETGYSVPHHLDYLVPYGDNHFDSLLFIENAKHRLDYLCKIQPFNQTTMIYSSNQEFIFLRYNLKDLLLS